MRRTSMKGAKAVEETQRQKLAELFAQEQVAVIVTQGEEWPTATLQAFAETPELDLLFIMGDTAEKFQNLLKRPKVTVMVDTRDIGDVSKFQISRSGCRESQEKLPRESSGIR